MQERKDAVTLKGVPFTVLGKQVETGDNAPNFTVAMNIVQDITSQELLPGKVTILSAVPSLDTGICDAQTRKFNEEVDKMGGDAQVVTISTDLPSAQARWCSAAGLDNSLTYSDHKTLAFGNAYGCHIKELRILQRSVFVVDKEGVVRYVEYLPEVGRHPDYEGALDAMKALL